jgi:uncharacterized membrane protein YphA (DoxX/SURF4 family)
MQLRSAQKIHYTLRVAVAMCFIGHGAFGIITKPIWCNYFAVLGIGHDMAYRLMPILGSFDILLGLIMLVYPVRAIPLWLVVWGIVTALLRPASGEPFAEFIERAGNFGAPLTLLILHGGMPKKLRELFIPLSAKIQPDAKTMANLRICLRIIVFLLLAGHGWLNLLEKKGLITQYSSLGFSNPAFIARSVGIFEILAGFLVFIRPARPLLMALLVWQISSELFYPHYELFEWVERGGSYGTLLALWFAMGSRFPVKEEQRNPSHPGVSMNFFPGKKQLDLFWSLVRK